MVFVSILELLFGKRQYKESTMLQRKSRGRLYIWKLEGKGKESEKCQSQGGYC